MFIFRIRGVVVDGSPLCSRSTSETMLREGNGVFTSDDAGRSSPFKVHARAMPKHHLQSQQQRPSIDLSCEGIQR